MVKDSPSFVDSFQNLTPSVILQSIETLGFRCTGRMNMLNSYENRVFEIFLEDAAALIVKYYRPLRWSLTQIQEEHSFLNELLEDGVAVMTPISVDGRTCFEHAGFLYSLTKKYSGRMPDEILEQDFFSLGQLLARLHNVGARKSSSTRVRLESANAFRSLDFLSGWIWPDVRTQYLDLGFQLMEDLQDQESNFECQRIHGDCHRGNLLRGSEGFFLVDFDDFCMGPVVQDFWLLCGQHPSECQEQGGEEQAIAETCWSNFLDSYQELRGFDESQLRVIPLLKAYRQIQYSSWIAQRWTDGAFPSVFPQFQTYNYWLDELERLKKISHNYRS